MSTQPVPASPSSTDPALLRRLEELKAKIPSQRTGEAGALIDEAFAFAAERHGGQVRKSGEPYLAHPLEVAHLLADMKLDTVCLATGLLHDTVEDTDATIAEIRSRFGQEVGRCVDGVTKLGRLAFTSAEDRQSETYRKMLLAMVEDIRVILVKLADRLHNMRTLGYLSPERQQRIARETRDIYAPIALRLGMGKIRGELEDLAFSYLDPESYRKIADYIESSRDASEEFLAEVRDQVQRSLQAAEIPVRVQGRIKRPYSIHQKLERQRITLDQVYDLLALRVITDSTKSCYGALGVIHQQWRPLPGRFKDFIAMPRPNLYQSLHTSVITDSGHRFEVQIRTDEMHKMAEEGICAHWKYKEGRSGPDLDDRRMAWLRQMVEWQRDLKDSGDFLSTLKVDLYPEEVYVFTPKGKLTVLPRDASPVDFAYSIHTEVGNSCSGAKVDGRIVPLKYRLHNGDIVEVLTQKGREPSSDWLGFVKTSRARHKIRQFLNAKRRERAQEIGEKSLEREARRLKTPVKLLSSDRMLEIAREYGCSQIADLQVALGYGRYSARQIIAKLNPDPEPSVAEPTAHPTSEPTQIEHRGKDPLRVKGADDILVYRARCCNPINGEPILGYITRGKGVAVHARDCTNVQNLMYEAERRIDVEWAPAKGDITFKTRLKVYVDEDRPNILNDITNILSAEDVNISSVDSRPGKASDQRVAVVVDLMVEVRDVKQLERIRRRIAQLAYVREVSRGPRN